MVSESPLVPLLLAIGAPIVLRNVNLLSWAALQPRPSLRRSLRTSPSEALLCLVVAAVVLWNAAKLVSSSREAKDLFRHTGLPIGASSIALRSRAATLSASRLGLQRYRVDVDADLQEAGDPLERLLGRLGNMAGRQLYLLLGSDALLACHYCKQPLDLQLFALLPLLLEYLVHSILFGLLTSSQSVLNAVDSSLAPVWPCKVANSLPEGADVLQRARAAARANSRAWRGPAATVLLAMVLLEASSIFDLWPWSDKQHSPLHHWYHNRYLLRHTVLLLLPLLIYLYPSPPSLAIPPHVRIAASLASMQRSTNQTLSHLSLLELGREAIWRDRGLREAVGEWYEGEEEREGESQFGEKEVQAAKQRKLLKEDAERRVEELVRAQIRGVGGRIAAGAGEGETAKQVVK